MSLAIALTNLLIGTVYTSYGLMTILDLRAGYRTRGLSRFGVAWILMAFTCGPHHLVHALHALEDGRGGGLDLAVAAAGVPAGLTWFLLRVEALLGGRGDRFLPGTPAWVAAIPRLAVPFGIAVVVGAAALVVGGDARMTPRMVPNILLLGLYTLIGFYLARTQLANRRALGGWSLSGLALTVVFPTCGVMHAVYAAYVISAEYHLDWHGLVIDWLAVPAAVYFVWVTRALHVGDLSDWNEAADTVVRQEAFV